MGCPVSTPGRPREGVDPPELTRYSPRPSSARRRLSPRAENARRPPAQLRPGAEGPEKRSEGEAAGAPPALNDATTLSSGGASSRKDLCRSSVMLRTPARCHPGRAARWPWRWAQRARPLRGPERLAAPQCSAQPLQPRR